MDRYLLLTLVIISPMLMLLAPYQVAYAFWKEVRQRLSGHATLA